MKLVLLLLLLLFFLVMTIYKFFIDNKTFLFLILKEKYFIDWSPFSLLSIFLHRSRSDSRDSVNLDSHDCVI